MAKPKKEDSSESKDVPKKGRISIFERYKEFLEDHLSRDDHNTEKVTTRPLTVEAKGVFDYVEFTWEMHLDELRKDYPKIKENQWTLWGLRHVVDFTRLNQFPNVIEGDAFLHAPTMKGKKKDYLTPGTSGNFAFFLVGEQQSFLESSKKIIGPLLLSLTPLRASTHDMWKEIAEVMKTEGGSGQPRTDLDSKVTLLEDFSAKEKAIQDDPNLSDEQKEVKIERLWNLYNIFGDTGR